MIWNRIWEAASESPPSIPAMVADSRIAATNAFAMCSTFKWMLAAAVLAQHDHGGKILGQHLSYGPKDLLAHIPGNPRACRRRVAADRGAMQGRCRDERQYGREYVAEVHRRTLCADAIFCARSATLRRDWIGSNWASITNLPGDPRDTTTPNAMIAAMQTLLVGNSIIRDHPARCCRHG